VCIRVDSWLKHNPLRDLEFASTMVRGSRSSLHDIRSVILVPILFTFAGNLFPAGEPLRLHSLPYIVYLGYLQYLPRGEKLYAAMPGGFL